MPKKKPLLPGLARTRPAHLRLVGAPRPEEAPDSEPPPPPAPGAPVVALQHLQEPSRALALALLEDSDCKEAA